VYLSTLLVELGEDPDRPRPGRVWLRNRYRVHQRLCMAFPSHAAKTTDPKFLRPYSPASALHVHSPRTDQQAFLFRIDPLLANRAVILVQSAIRPDWEYAFQNAGHLLMAPPQVKPFDPSFASGQVWRFRLLANPTKRLREASRGPDGEPIRSEWVAKRVPVPTGMLEDWLLRRAGDAGFKVRHLSNIVTGYVSVAKERNGPGNRLRSAQYDGILEVTDPSRLYDTVVRGLGPGKGFGFGLMSVSPA
jgi:CRISPR system Cascade subunit CasE